ncbi:hypothetical protein Anapl_16790 [Anas platyrhynchos]|uniref:Uncharacterized protein n=1 Tax=Anas platyrhynchos TaxID=8839 RepID=R0KM16_ANAPL|nr:hypothetical protein Anapl_16790 [Anas platyrhynchos]
MVLSSNAAICILLSFPSEIERLSGEISNYLNVTNFWDEESEQLNGPGAFRAVCALVLTAVQGGRARKMDKGLNPAFRFQLSNSPFLRQPLIPAPVSRIVTAVLLLSSRRKKGITACAVADKPGSSAKSK